MATGRPSSRLGHTATKATAPGRSITYRTAAELDEWKRSRDPITRLAEAMREAGLADLDEQAAIETRVAGRVAEAIAFAEASPLPSTGRRRRRRHRDGPARPGERMTPITYSKAFSEGVREEMARDPSIFIMGTDLLSRGGNFAQLVGVGAEFGPERVRDTPISEAAMVAAGVGAAVGGMRPIVDLNFLDFAFGRDGRDRQPGREDALHAPGPGAARHPGELRRDALRDAAQQLDRDLVRPHAGAHRR